jgi:hypothetical protein
MNTVLYNEYEFYKIHDWIESLYYIDYPYKFWKKNWKLFNRLTIYEFLLNIDNFEGFQ